ncbi:MAG: hypothetical protein GY874_23235 [Desulfobacteraceae bacterium]|nr:hypothetical protein [Desulfobacteraceae bacterium]
MHIYNYQVDNVLNEYRKQLNRGPGKDANEKSLHLESGGQMQQFKAKQHQSVFEQLSDKIMGKIKVKNPGNQAIAQHDDTKKDLPINHNAAGKRLDLRYNVIDPHNQKITKSITFQALEFNWKGNEYSNRQTDADRRLSGEA